MVSRYDCDSDLRPSVAPLLGRMARRLVRLPVGGLALARAVERRLAARAAREGDVGGAALLAAGADIRLGGGRESGRRAVTVTRLTAVRVTMRSGDHRLTVTVARLSAVRVPVRGLLHLRAVRVSMLVLAGVSAARVRVAVILRLRRAVAVALLAAVRMTVLDEREEEERGRGAKEESARTSNKEDRTVRTISRAIAAQRSKAATIHRSPLGEHQRCQRSSAHGQFGHGEMRACSPCSSCPQVRSSFVRRALAGSMAPSGSRPCHGWY